MTEKNFWIWVATLLLESTFYRFDFFLPPTCQLIPLKSSCLLLFVCLFLNCRSDVALLMRIFILYLFFVKKKEKMIYVLERAIICRHMVLCTKVVVTNLFIFFVFADHTDGFSWWNQWKQHPSATNSGRCNSGLSRPKNQRKRCLQLQHDGPSAAAATTPAAATTSFTAPASTAPTTKQGQWNGHEDELDYKLPTTEYDRKRTLQYVRDNWPSWVLSSNEGL